MTLTLTRRDSSTLFCRSCKEENATGSFCAKCGEPLHIAAAQLAALIGDRLRFEGFMTPESDDEMRLSSSLKAVVSELSGGAVREILLAPSLPQHRTAMALTVAMTVNATRAAAASVERLTADLLTTMHAFAAETNVRTRAIVLKVYMVYARGLSAEALKSHRLPLGRRIRRKRRGRSLFMVTVELKPIDAKTGSSPYLARYQTADRAVRSAVGQLSKVRGTDQRKDGVVGRMIGLVLQKPIDQLRDYARLMGLAGEYEMLALKIRGGRLATAELSKAVAISAVIAALLAQLFGVDTGRISVGISLVDSILEGLLLIALYLVGAASVHWPLRLFGGKATFRDTFTASTFISAAGYPLVVLMVGIATIMGMEESEAWRAAQAGTAGVSMVLLSAVHDLSLTRSFAATFVPVAVLVMIVVGVALAF